MVFHWTSLPERQQGSEAGSCLGAAAGGPPCAASGAAAARRTSAADTAPRSWEGDAAPAELPAQHVGLSHYRQKSVAAAFERRKW